ncbi:MAG: hypothetical protein ABFR65_01095 [Pseudomonadota bacterium]
MVSIREPAWPGRIALSSVFNEGMVKRVGANLFLAKFNPHELATLVTERLHTLA